MSNIISKKDIERYRNLLRKKQVSNENLVPPILFHRFDIVNRRLYQSIAGKIKRENPGQYRLFQKKNTQWRNELISDYSSHLLDDVIRDIIPSSKLKKISTGAYGTGFLIEDKKATQHLYNHNKKYGRNIIPNKEAHYKCMVKVQLLQNPGDENNAIKEDSFLYTITNYRLRNKYVTIRGNSLIPYFYIGGTLQYQGFHYRFTVMRFIPGKTLYETFQQHHYTPRMNATEYVRLEAKFLLLWYIGFTHTDAHSDNVIVSKTDNPFLIDLGFFVKISEKLHKVFMQEFDTVLANFQPQKLDYILKTVFKKIYKPYISLVIYKRLGFDTTNQEFKLNLDDTLLLGFRNKIPSDKVNAARVKYWTKKIHSPVVRRLKI